MAGDAVSSFEELLSEKMRDEMNALAAAFPEKKSLNIDYSLLEKFDPSLADALLENPDAVIAAANTAASRISVFQEKKIEPHIRFLNLPEANEVDVQNLGASQLNKLIRVRGVVSWITMILPLMKTAAWECIHCGNIVKTPSEKNIVRPPGLCKCGHRGEAFRLVEQSSEFINIQRAGLQEPVEKLRGSTPASSIELWLEDDLVNVVAPGEKVVVTGVLRLKPKPAREAKGRSSVYDKFLDVNHICKEEREFEEISISKEEEKKIIELSKNPRLYELITQSIAPRIYGYDELKQAIALQLFGGTPNKVLPDKGKIRSDMHVLLVGDPGTAKSVTLEYVSRLAPKSVFVSGGGASGVGLTAAAERDPEGGWILKAGAMVLANGGLAVIDEFDKMCLSGDSMVYLGDGVIKPIKEVFVEAEKEFGAIKENDVEVVKAEIPVLTHLNGRIVVGKTTAVTRRKTSEPFYEIVLRSGKRLKATLNHSILVFSEDGVLEYKRVHEMSEGAFVACPRKIPSPQKTVQKIGSLKTRFTKAASPEMLVDEEFGELMGYLASEGCTPASPAHRSYRDDFMNYSSEVSARYKELTERLRITESKKQAKHPNLLRENKAAVENKKRFASLDTVPHAGALIKSARKKLGLHGHQLGLSPGTISVFERGLSNPSKKALKKIVSVLKACANPLPASEEINKLEFLAECDLYFDEVIALNEVENREGYAYNLSVKGSKNFVANGVIVHNSDEDRGLMHQAMEQQVVSIAKAGIVTQFQARTAVLAAANPEFGRFDATKPPAQQFNITPGLMSRFDLIFTIRDILDEKRDREMAEHILLGHKYAADKTIAPPAESALLPAIPIDLLQKYIAYARKNVFPTMTEEAMDKIKEFYVDLRRLGVKQENYPITARQIEAIIRLAEAVAKARLSPRVELQDAERAISLINHVLRDVFMDKETGRIDSDIIYVGQPKSKIDKMRSVMEIVSSLEKKFDLVSKEDVVREAVAFGIDGKYVEQLIDVLLRQGELYSPRSGFVKSARKKWE